MDMNSLAHTKWNCKYHIVFAPKYRRKIIYGQLKRDLGNPCTMQIISKHWTDENLKSPAKPVNAPLIKKYTGVENYKGRADQIQEVMKHVTEENYVDMCQRVRNLELDDSITGSSNFGKFIKLFESDDSGWIEILNEQIE